MSTMTINFMGEDWLVEYNYSAGTNYLIHSASLEPNDPEELEIESIKHSSGAFCGEFSEAFLDYHLDAIEDLVWEKIGERDE